ncbi:Crp/Fnr family transcriptional regulator [Indiicoccus explosivorum]|uniref:Crp/Fnr family transcriptional regulator n=1 Tax=Indiicoccus explosivorum TaxID=1917864 RepID=UPI000B451074|nr:Crp/Fnr family transcriptional regulator [Indiicoccus explosivorum]
MQKEKRNDQSLTSPSTRKLCVSMVPIFNHLEPDEMREIAGTATSLSLKRGELLYSAGDRADTLYIIHKGRVKIYRLTESGKEQLVRVLEPGDFTGETALFSDSVHDAFAEAAEQTEICRIQRADLRAFLIKYPQISLKILSEFSSRLERAEEQATSFATEDTETRIALYLLNQRKIQQSDDVKLTVTRKDLASLLGTTPETVSRKLGFFEESGWISQESHRKIRILDPDALQR